MSVAHVPAKKWSEDVRKAVDINPMKYAPTARLSKHTYWYSDELSV